MRRGLTDEQVAAADIDGDGKVDSTDIYYMLYYVALQGAGKNPSWQDVIY
ncbi:MAG: dockerin type I domain-containing protein [Ruminococcus callidus]